VMISSVLFSVCYFSSTVDEKEEHADAIFHANRNFRSHVLSLPGTKVSYMELSLPGTFVPWNSRSQELSSPGTFAPLSENEVELLLFAQELTL